ncbi:MULTISPECIES: hypothetical protein [unclassified Spirillospora]|uniref:hypothetical protein n=1 Tax=unclassified Spirillospora TaxID=2642701 RepID=UPI00371C6A5D
MTEKPESPEPAPSTAEGSCCGVNACCTGAEQAVNPGVTVHQAKTEAGCGCLRSSDDDAAGAGVPAGAGFASGHAHGHAGDS